MVCLVVADSWNAGDGQWSDAASWSGGHVPCPADTVLIGSAVESVVELSDNIATRGIYFGSRGSGIVPLDFIKIRFLNKQQAASATYTVISSSNSTVCGPSGKIAELEVDQCYSFLFLMFYLP